MSLLNTVAMGIGYTIMVCAILLLFWAFILWIIDRRDNKPARASIPNREKLEVMLAGFRSDMDIMTHSIQEDIGELTARVNGIENVIDQFRPAPDYKHEKPQQGDDIS